MSRTRRFGGLWASTPAGDHAEPGETHVSDGSDEDVVAAAPDELDPDHVPYWDVWAGPIGHAVRPELETLEAAVPTLTAGIAMTPSGRALCSVGLDENGSTRTAAMVSNMLALGASAMAMSTIDETAGDQLVTLTHGNQRGVAIVIDDLIVDRLILWVAATEVNLGVLSVQARSAAERIAEILVNTDDAPAEPATGGLQQRPPGTRLDSA